LQTKCCKETQVNNGTVIDGIGIQDVFFPWVKEVTYSETAINLAAGDSQEVEVTVSMSNLQENVTGKKALMALLTFTLDENVALLEFTDEGNIRIVAVAAGTTDLEVSRTVGSVAPRLPELPDIVPLPSLPSITVT